MFLCLLHSFFLLLYIFTIPYFFLFLSFTLKICHPRCATHSPGWHDDRYCESLSPPCACVLVDYEAWSEKNKLAQKRPESLGCRLRRGTLSGMNLISNHILCLLVLFLFILPWQNPFCTCCSIFLIKYDFIFCFCTSVSKPLFKSCTFVFKTNDPHTCKCSIVSC